MPKVEVTEVEHFFLSARAQMGKEALEDRLQTAFLNLNTVLAAHLKPITPKTTLKVGAQDLADMLAVTACMGEHLKRVTGSGFDPELPLHVDAKRAAAGLPEPPSQDEVDRAWTEGYAEGVKATTDEYEKDARYDDDLRPFEVGPVTLEAFNQALDEQRTLNAHTEGEGAEDIA